MECSFIIVFYMRKDMEHKIVKKLRSNEWQSEGESFRKMFKRQSKYVQRSAKFVQRQCNATQEGAFVDLIQEQPNKPILCITYFPQYHMRFRSTACVQIQTTQKKLTVVAGFPRQVCETVVAKSEGTQRGRIPTAAFGP